MSDLDDLELSQKTYGVLGIAGTILTVLVLLGTYLDVYVSVEWIARWPGQSPQYLISVPYGLLSAIALALGALKDLLLWLDVRDQAYRTLEHKLNRWRCYEMMITSPLVHMQVAMVCGVTDIFFLLLAAGLRFGVQALAWLTEYAYMTDDRNEVPHHKRSVVVTLVLMVWYWAILLPIFIHGPNPGWVFGVVIGVAVWDILQWLCLMLATWGYVENFQWIDCAYTFLEFAGKTLVAVTIYAGTR